VSIETSCSTLVAMNMGARYALPTAKKLWKQRGMAPPRYRTCSLGHGTGMPPRRATQKVLMAWVQVAAWSMVSAPSSRNAWLSSEQNSRPRSVAADVHSRTAMYMS